MITKVKTANI